jgi:hypothetical protein
MHSNVLNTTAAMLSLRMLFVCCRGVAGAPYLLSGQLRLLPLSLQQWITQQATAQAAEQHRKCAAHQLLCQPEGLLQCSRRLAGMPNCRKLLQLASCQPQLPQLLVQQ